MRRARTSDVPEIKRLIDIYSGRILLEKNLVTLYESVQEFWVAERDGNVIGCGAMHVLWADLGEVRTVAVDPSAKGQGAGTPRGGQADRGGAGTRTRALFVLTFEVDFFGKHGFVEIDGTPVTAEVYAEMCRSYDTGVAEFLDLSYVKPNTLGNTRMLLTLLKSQCVRQKCPDPALFDEPVPESENMSLFVVEYTYSADTVAGRDSIAPPTASGSVSSPSGRPSCRPAPSPTAAAHSSSSTPPTRRL